MLYNCGEPAFYVPIFSIEKVKVFILYERSEGENKNC